MTKLDLSWAKFSNGTQETLLFLFPFTQVLNVSKIPFYHYFNGLQENGLIAPGQSFEQIQDILKEVAKLGWLGPPRLIAGYIFRNIPSAISLFLRKRAQQQCQVSDSPQ